MRSIPCTANHNRIAKRPFRAGHLLLAVMLAMLLLDATARAQSGETVVRLPSTSYTAGQELVFSIWVTNPGTGPAQASFPDTLGCRLLSSGSPPRRVKAQAVESLPGGTQVIAPGGFAARDYRLGLPSDLEGTVALELDDRKAPSVLFVASPAVESDPLLAESLIDYRQRNEAFRIGFASDRNLSEFFQSSNAGEAFALLKSEKREKSISGVEVSGEIARKDALQKAVYFENLQILTPATYLEKSQRHLRNLLMTDLFAEAVSHVEALKQWKS